MADIVKVTTTSNHLGSQGFKKVGDEYEVTADIAALLKGSGLVDFGGAGKKDAGTPVQFSNKVVYGAPGPELEKVVRQPTPEKKEITKPTTKK